MDLYSFYTGQAFDAHQWFGAHVTSAGVQFRTFAPGAEKVSVLLHDTEYPMQRVLDGNIYELTVASAHVGDLYEYRIYSTDGCVQDHCDPFGFGMELRPAHRSIVRDLNAFSFSDQVWMRSRTDCKDKPLNIYELHLGSWKKKGDGETDWYRYDELAELLIPYLKETGYNYIELLPISEHPCDESWGYQNTGFFAPTSRYGTAEDLMRMIDRLHKHDIGVILDFVPVHFAVDSYGLTRYDGTALFEYPHSDVGVSEWGSYNFMHSRGEVRSFLQSCANYWLTAYHIDGLRMDAVSRIIYWQGDKRRGVNGNAVDFIKVMNKGLKARHRGCILIAEDSTSYGGVTAPVDEGGLGFDYKWDMGWMHDTLEYFQTAPAYRPKDYHKLTFSMMYFPNEYYLLPFSHDEVVHGKATILQKMNGQYADKFPQARAMYLYMMLHPGKKLNFMGNELGQLREWSEKQEQDWLLTSYPIHDAFYHYIAELNRLYLSHTAFSHWDYRDGGFCWLDCHQENRCIYAVERRSEDERLIGIFNFSDREQNGYELSVADAKHPELLLHSDWHRFGGDTSEGETVYRFDNNHFAIDLKPFSGVLFSCKKLEI